MKPFLKQFVILSFSSILVACAGTPGDDSREPSPRGDCIHEPSIRGYTVLDERNLIVDAGRRSYHLVLQRRAWGLKSSWGIAFDTTTSRVCAGFDKMMFKGHLDGESIRIESIQALTPEEEEHLLIRFGKKEPEIEHTPPPGEVKGADVEELGPDGSE
jgi:hypothetical protein